MILKSKKFVSLIFPFIALALLVSGSFTSSPQPADAQAVGNPDLCFSVSDGQNELRYKNRLTGAETTVGGTGVLNLEALEMSLDNAFLYTVDDPDEDVHTDQGQFGYLANYMTSGGGDFTLIGAIPAAHNALFGTQNLDDVDSLSLDARTNKLWGITQDPGNNLIFQINMTNGDHISDIFGAGYDYARVDLGVDDQGTPLTLADDTIRACGGGVIACGTNCPDTLDDLAIDPTGGTFYAIGNAITGASTEDYMMRIDVDGVNPANSLGFDPARGDVFACAIDALQIEDTPGNFITINDMEGFGVHNDGTFYGTTGTETVSPSPSGVELKSSMYRIDPPTATVFYLVAATPSAGNWGANDTEAITCMTAGSNLITGTVYLDADPADNEQYKPVAGDVSQENVTVELYLDNNNDGAFNAGDTLLQSQLTGVNPGDPTNDGFYSFPVGITGNFAVRILPATLPAGVAMTTDNQEEADFPNWGNLDPNNDYGFNLAATGLDLGITKDDGVTTYTPGGTLVYSIIVTNFGPADAVGATVTDTFPPEFTSVSWTCTPTAGATCTAGPVLNDINDTVNIPVNGILTYTATVQIDPTATLPITNVAEVDHPDDRDPNNNRDDDTDRTQTQGLDLAITKDDGTDVYTPGGALTYQIIVTNVGTEDASNATVTDTFPPQLLNPSWTCSPSAGATCTAGPVQGYINDTVSVPVGGTLTYTVHVTVSQDAQGELLNTAEVSHPNDRDPNNNRDDDRDFPPGQAPGYDLAITKQVNPPSVLPGGVVTWTISVTNTGAGSLTGVTVTDPIDPNFFSEITNATVSKGTVFISGLNVTFNIGDLAVGESVSMTIVTRIKDGVTSGSSTNTATATANEIPGIRQASATVTVEVTILPATGYPPAAADEPESGPRYWLLGVTLILGIAGLFAWRKLR